ncbi:MAG: hypothetical protein Q7T55_15945 [Solirubrobacteraceae bacterium]|nr:hypothetical protein [Solirubrobacteraceae bacterium]
MSHRLVEVAEGMLALAGSRLAPGGADLPRHYVLTARALAETEFAAHQLYGDEPLSDDPETAALMRSGDAAYTAMEAAQVFWALALRLRSRATGLHADEAGVPLRESLLELAQDATDLPPGQQGLDAAARALLLAAVVVDLAADEPQRLRGAPIVDAAVHQLVEHGVLTLLRVAVAFQEDAGLR